MIKMKSSSHPVEFVDRLLRTNNVGVELIRSNADAIAQMIIPQGSLVSAESESVDGCLIYLQTGMMVATIKTSADGVACHPIMMFGHGMWLGTKQALEQLYELEPSASVDYLAVSDVRAVILKRQLVRRMLEQQPEFRNFVMKISVTEATRFIDTMVQLKFGNTIHRVICGIAALVDAFLRVSHMTSGGHPVSYIPDVSLALKQSVVADLCGVSRSAISPILRRLQRHGWVHISYGQMVICNPMAWSRFGMELREGRPIGRAVSLDEVLAGLSVCAQTDDHRPFVRYVVGPLTADDREAV
jgi:CRP-like cAMP-binding protein